ncbi:MULTISPECIES: ProQ/FinO family protein [Rhizobium/Agrobacterium group]|uniref:ProQ/FinO domain-containing protein n=2 Tax=Rhizobium/Agrobacterium group TaxID=227290 RepID=B9K3W0_ALLAM|nr:MULTISPECIES: ProQ/FinO family protein [Rhizobium/Agrobacterium group]ACM39615.1 conserved hypothetical protein [Allorhizobium ampelinum S4]ASK49650.1 transposase [Agrobacterium vitis]MCF1437063.1 hypothetical protein [Allorhizobium ampelinum]MCF1450735.1 hypothetical protein [Allorhizobium ampelinum]MCF1496374.1 hypothetical protein [Allorhizobium ampelinum]
MNDSNTKPLSPWKASRGPIKVDRYSLEAAKAVNALLNEPIAVLPSAEGETVLPFRIGINTDIERRLRPDAALSDLRKALRRYTHSAAYLYATAQPDALRHDIVGQPCEAVRDEDRLNARQSFLIVQERRKQRRQQRESENLAQN